MKSLMCHPYWGRVPWINHETNPGDYQFLSA
ncbi:unnamed protein product [Ectocarpus sp. CCAP 1310/34]|nr:unnamed protein product [Ectocarpus sp. CCAP 1310/34]